MLCRMTVPHCDISCFVDRAYRYNRVEKNQPDAQLIDSVFREPLYVSVISRPIFRRYNRMYTKFGTVLVGLESNPSRTTII